MVSSGGRGQRVLVCYGRTRAYLDAVRYLTSDSSGKMGRALVAAARAAHLSVISLDVGVAPHRQQQAPLISNQTVLKTIIMQLPRVKYLVCLVAFNDFCWSVPAKVKLDKAVVTKSQLCLSLNCDVLATIATHKRSDQVFVGFCLQNSLADLTRARRKMYNKKLDMMVVNDLSSVGATTTQVIILTRTTTYRLPRQTKVLTARTVIDLMMRLDP